MDWHFAINTRVSESAKAVVNRSWYIGEREWIAYRENASSSNTSGADDGASSGNGTPTKDGKKKVKEFVVPVPTDISQQGAVCPVCQEKFDTKWHEEMQMPVWANAISVKGRVYHKTCYDEVVHNALGGGGGGAMAGVMGRGRGGSARNTPTPERVLGKRKLDVEGMADVGVKYSRV